MSGPLDPAPIGRRARDDAIAEILAAAGYAGAPLDYLAGDASFRRYARIAKGKRTAMVMDVPPEKEDVRRWQRIAEHLRDLGFSAPEVIAADADNGLLVIEDFGEETFTRALAAGADEAALYDLAIDVLVALHGLPENTVAPKWLPPYDDQRLLEEALLFVDWYLPALYGARPPDAEREGFAALWREALADARMVPQTLVLRDYHVDNLMRLPGRSGTAACGLLDFQDAVAGPSAYDVISLIEDARRDLGPGIAGRALDRYLAGVPRADPDAFQAAAAVLAAGRNAKIIGIFTRLWKRDGKPQYLSHIPRVWRLLEGDLAHPALAALKAWFDHAVPSKDRMAPGPVGDSP